MITTISFPSTFTQHPWHSTSLSYIKPHAIVILYAYAGWIDKRLNEERKKHKTAANKKRLPENRNKRTILQL
jgi:hypothetical protein